nr:type I inositol polyphosphate 5-phosphatase 12-like isoform X2 [Tanacetum cinerariifolium]
MLGKRRTKKRKDASEGNDKNRTRVSRVGRVMHCTMCHKEGHNRKGCKSGVQVQIGDAGNAGTQAAKGGVGRTKNMIRRGGSNASRGSSSSGGIMAVKDSSHASGQVTINGACSISSSDVKYMLSDNVKSKIWAANSVVNSLIFGNHRDARTRELLKVYNVDGQVNNRVAMACEKVQPLEEEVSVIAKDFVVLFGSLSVSPGPELKPATIGIPITVTVSRSDTSKSDMISPVTSVPVTSLATTADVGIPKTPVSVPVSSQTAFVILSSFPL